MRIQENEGETFEFPEEGVKVYIPPQEKYERVIPIKLELRWLPGMREQENFTPFRLVINLEFIAEERLISFIESSKDEDIREKYKHLLEISQGRHLDFSSRELQDEFSALAEIVRDQYLEEFNPPLMFTVNFTEEDLGQPKGGEKDLKIAFWKNDEWILITEEKHQLESYKDGDPDWAGYFQFNIAHWGEPSIALGE